VSQFNFSDSTSSRFSIRDYSGINTGGGDDLPHRLKEYDQWLVTHDTPWNDKRHKSPKYLSEGWNDGDLLSFKEAHIRAEQEDNTAVAFRFTEDGLFIGFDLDDVKVDDKFTDEALEIVRRLDSYTEVSSSGTGLHVIAEGERVDDRKSRGGLSDNGHLEVYEQSRYFVLTGDVYGGHTSVESRMTAVQGVQDDHLPTRESFSFSDQQAPKNGLEFDGRDVDIMPEQVRQTIREYVKGADVDEELLRLWNGSDEGRKSTSEADMAFVKQLYFWCRGDQQLLDACFRASDRMRPKWDEVHSSDGATYGEMTIRKVCHSNSDTFEGRYVP